MNPARWVKRYESLEFPSNDFKNTLPSIEQPPVLELNELPSHLKYVYLEEKETLPIIISSQLTTIQEEQLVTALKRHKKKLLVGNWLTSRE